MVIEEYEIHNLDCANCSARIESEIANLTEVSSVNLDFINKKLTIQYHKKPQNPLEQLNSIASKIEPGVLLTNKGSGSLSSDGKPWFIVIAVLLLAVSLFSNPWLSLSLGLAAYIIAGHKVFRAAFRELFTRQVFAEHFLMTIATLGALFLGEFTEAIAVMILYEIGQYLEGKAVNRSRDSLQTLLALKPETAHLKTTAGIADVKVSELKIGNTVLVYPGERIPIDSKIIRGESTVDTSSLTGESEPVFVSADAKVFAGYVNSHSLLEMEVTTSEAESMISRILRMIEGASARKSSPEKFITRFARYYTPAVVFGALLVFIVPTLMGFPAAIWFKRALVFLIVSCPCALVISIPLSYYIGIGKAAKHGIILKGSEYLDLLRKVHTLVFDKTGTLTTGELKLSAVIPAPGISAELLQQSLYRSEWTSSHPFAKAIKAQFKGEYSAEAVSAHTEFPGKGIVQVYNGDTIITGSEQFLRGYGFLGFCDPGTKSVVHCGQNGTYLGCVTFDDELKPELKNSLKTLRQLGIKHLSMLSGDRLPKAEQVAKELELDSFHAGLLPEEKLAELEKIIAATDGLVAFCGDGLNDAPVLARADLSIAMGKIGAQASIDTADIVLLNDDPQQLTAAFELSHRTNHLVWQNIIIALGVKIVIMCMGLSGISGLWEAIIADVGVTLFVIFNSLRMMKT